MLLQCDPLSSTLSSPSSLLRKLSLSAAQTSLPTTARGVVRPMNLVGNNSPCRLELWLLITSKSFLRSQRLGNASSFSRSLWDASPSDRLFFSFFWNRVVSYYMFNFLLYSDVFFRKVQGANIAPLLLLKESEYIYCIYLLIISLKTTTLLRCRCRH